MKNIVKITHKKKLLAFIIRKKFKKEKLHFFTPADYPQQLAYMHRPAGYEIRPHLHKPALRNIRFTQEVLFIKSGKVRIDFYDHKKQYLESRIVSRGDFVFLAAGGHGFRFIQKAEIIEIKQGPFLGDSYTVKFNPVEKTKLKG